MKTKILASVSIIAVMCMGIWTSVFASMPESLDNGTWNTYEEQIKMQGREIMKKYIQWDKLNTFSKDLSQNEGSESYKKYISDTVDSLIKSKKIDKNTVTPEFKILDEYNRVINTEKISADTPTTSVGPILTGNQKNLTTDAQFTIKLPNYNRTTAVNYAYKWALWRNPSYNFYSGLNDCTDFISQILYTGSLPYVTSWWLGKFDDSNWYYKSNAPSWTWGGANNFFKHARLSTSKYTLVSSIFNLQIWDILQMDFEGDWIIDHAAVITKITGSTKTSQIYLTYHSSDTKDKPLSDFISKVSPKTKYYGWKVIY